MRKEFLGAQAMSDDTMMHIVIDNELLDVYDTKYIGGKAQGLSMLARCGYAIPSTHILTINGYRDFLDSKGRCDDSELQKLADAMFKDLTCLGYGVTILRSSAENEDGVNASFSGMMKSTVVKREETHDRLKRIIQGMLIAPLNNHYQEYNKAKGLAGYPQHFTFVIQPYLSSELSGVLFTADPVSGSEKTVVIETVLGGNEALTSGTAVPALINIDTVSKSVTRFESGDEELRPDDNLLTLMIQLSTHAKAIESLMKHPQDIEWLYRDGEFVFLQTRPITTI